MAVTQENLAERVEVSREGAVGILRVNRPERKNAMTAEMSEAFIDRLTELEEDSAIRAVIITGAGDTFLSGADVGTVTSKVSEMDPVAWRGFRDLAHRQFAVLYSMTKPTIAAVNGWAVVTGVDVAVTCDIRIVSDRSRFRVGFRRMGLMPTPGICYLLPNLVGSGWAKRMAFTDRFVDASEAKAIGLVEEVVPDVQLMERALELARELASGPSMMIGATKEAMNRAFGLDFERIRRDIDNSQFVLTRTRDHAEAMKAFAERRDPVYIGS